MKTPDITIGWLLALIALLLALAIIFIPGAVPFNHITTGVDILLAAAARLLT